MAPRTNLQSSEDWTVTQASALLVLPFATDGKEGPETRELGMRC